MIKYNNKKLPKATIRAVLMTMLISAAVHAPQDVGIQTDGLGGASSSNGPLSSNLGQMSLSERFEGLRADILSSIRTIVENYDSIENTFPLLKTLDISQAEGLALEMEAALKQNNNIMQELSSVLGEKWSIDFIGSIKFDGLKEDLKSLSHRDCDIRAALIKEYCSLENRKLKALNQEREQEELEALNQLLVRKKEEHEQELEALRKANRLKREELEGSGRQLERKKEELKEEEKAAKTPRITSLEEEYERIQISEAIRREVIKQQVELAREKVASTTVGGNTEGNGQSSAASSASAASVPNSSGQERLRNTDRLLTKIAGLIEEIEKRQQNILPTSPEERAVGLTGQGLSKAISVQMEVDNKISELILVRKEFISRNELLEIAFVDKELQSEAIAKIQHIDLMDEDMRRLIDRSKSLRFDSLFAKFDSILGNIPNTKKERTDNRSSLSSVPSSEYSGQQLLIEMQVLNRKIIQNSEDLESSLRMPDSEFTMPKLEELDSSHSKMNNRLKRLILLNTQLKSLILDGRYSSEIEMGAQKAMSSIEENITRFSYNGEAFTEKILAIKENIQNRTAGASSEAAASSSGAASNGTAAAGAPIPTPRDQIRKYYYYIKQLSDHFPQTEQGPLLEKINNLPGSISDELEREAIKIFRGKKALDEIKLTGFKEKVEELDGQINAIKSGLDGIPPGKSRSHIEGLIRNGDIVGASKKLLEEQSLVTQTTTASSATAVSSASSASAAIKLSESDMGFDGPDPEMMILNRQKFPTLPKTLPMHITLKKGQGLKVETGIEWNSSKEESIKVVKVIINGEIWTDGVLTILFNAINSDQGTWHLSTRSSFPAEIMEALRTKSGCNFDKKLLEDLRLTRHSQFCIARNDGPKNKKGPLYLKIIDKHGTEDYYNLKTGEKIALIP